MESSCFSLTTGFLHLSIAFICLILFICDSACLQSRFSLLAAPEKPFYHFEHFSLFAFLGTLAELWQLAGDWGLGLYSGIGVWSGLDTRTFDSHLSGSRAQEGFASEDPRVSLTKRLKTAPDGSPFLWCLVYEMQPRKARTCHISLFLLTYLISVSQSLAGVF